ncbi:family 16 glycosylhydrolase [Microvirga alba]|uniref:Family 16 glycosylhydrolase n=1 Tax=Microvirga alba TaxID=2791025 RepID=A0A931BTD6_9HYPH|nr:family 16 glycosylhydrolase [Microvirga alba]MBF9234419.1 family 16 glycosylhydrolase [Microvirga alba]
MTPAANPDIPAGSDFPLPVAVQSVRQARSLQWLSYPLAYTIGTTVASFMSLGTSLLAPSLLGPAAFGSFALLTSLFQYASKFDLGLSQLADRNLTTGGASSVEHGAEILRANWIIGGFVLLVMVPIAAFGAFISGRLSPFETALAIAGGALGMIANAPVTIFRASGQVWEFSAVALTLQAGMTVPRLAGLVFAGITGCFAVLVLWYGVLAMCFARAGLPSSRRRASIWPLLRTALPLFVFNALWLVYLTANRWIAAALSTPDELGLFAFGANLALVGLGILSTIAQVHYPKLLARIARQSPGACSGLVERQSLFLGIALASIALLAMFTAHPLILRLFPQFEGAAVSTIALAISCISLGLITWIIPMVIALSPTPKRDAALIFAPGFLILIGAMALGDHVAGIAGQAWGCVAAGLVLLACLLARMYLLGIVTGRSALRIYAVQIALVCGLSALALSSSSPRDVMAAIYTRSADAVPPPGWRLAFEDSFSSLQLRHAGSGVWDAQYPWGGRTNPSNGELQYYVDPRPGADTEEVRQLNPFSIESASLVIRARPFARTSSTGMRYASGLLSSARSFSFTYGYAEIRARVPQGRGLWSAFWLAPTDQSWPPEIDIMEVLGHDTRANFVTAHTRRFLRASMSQFRIPTPDLSAAFHTYAVKWTAEELVWYFDGRSVTRMPTPSDMHRPMYMIVNLAVGGSWPGVPDSSTRFPADLRVDRIRVFLPPDASPAAEH